MKSTKKNFVHKRDYEDLYQNYQEALRQLQKLIKIQINPSLDKAAEPLLSEKSRSNIDQEVEGQA